MIICLAYITASDLEESFSSVIAQHRSVERWMFSVASVCLFVCGCFCQHDNFRTSKHRMMKLRGRRIVQKSRPSSNLGVIAPWVRTPKNVALGDDVGKISAGCLVQSIVQ